MKPSEPPICAFETPIVDRNGVDQALADMAAPVVRAALELSRRFGAGGRLFATGSGLAAHDARHVAVEFIHPVIVGKRSLPAVALPAAEAASRLRLLARRDDALLVIGPSPENAVDAAQDLGLLTISLGGDSRCAHALALDTADPLVARELQVTLYHLLWELVHIFHEREAGCITCSDRACPCVIVEIHPDGLATARGERGLETICLDLVDASTGDTVLVHAGTAISRL